MCHRYCFTLCFCPLPGYAGSLGGTGLHGQHPRRGAVQSPSAIFRQLAASSVVVATGREGPQQTSVARWRPWCGHRQTHQLAYSLPASYRHHGGRPWQVQLQTTVRSVCALTWLRPQVSCTFSFSKIVFRQDNLLRLLEAKGNLWLFCSILCIIWNSASLFSLTAALIVVCLGISPPSPCCYFTSMAINNTHILFFFRPLWWRGFQPLSKSAPLGFIYNTYFYVDGGSNLNKSICCTHCLVQGSCIR